MPNRSTTQRAKKDLREGKSPSTAAGEFVHEEIEHVRKGKHGARSPRQAIAIGLSKARRAGVPLPPPRAGKTSTEARKKASRDYERGQSAAGGSRSSRVSRARERVLEQEPHDSASPRALSAQTRRAAQKRGRESRHEAAQKAVETKGARGRASAARKAARTRGAKKVA
ncbi:MAG: DUF6496 domain-containing protein [Terracidiphilus sp.]|jgi:hypothetical protein